MERLGTLYKLHQIFSMGYLPSRKDETYYMFNPKMRMMYGGMVNCFEHACFNLTNKLLYEYNFDDLDMINFGERMAYDAMYSKERILKNAIKFVNATGLIMKEASPKIILKSNEWLVSAYLTKSSTINDFHFFLQEREGYWSGKCGYELETETFDTLPKIYTAPHEATFKIQNPFVK